MKTIVVGVLAEYMKNYLVSPTYRITIDDQPVRVLLHSNPHMTQSADADVLANYDILLTATAKLPTMVPKGLTEITVPRLNKVEQANYFNSQFAHLPRFNPIPTWDVDNITPAIRSDRSLADQDQWIIKPSNGARGIGFFLSAPGTLGINNFVTTFKVASKNTETPLIDAMAAFGHTYLGAEREFSKNEGISFLKDAIVQPVVRGVIAEYRLILGKKEILGGYLRSRGNNPLGQPDLKDNDLSLNIQPDAYEHQISDYLVGSLPDDIAAVVPTTVREALSEIVSKIPDYNAVDLYFTYHDGKVKWGIFEISNQWGWSGCCELTENEIMEKIIVSMVKTHLDNVEDKKIKCGNKYSLP